MATSAWFRVVAITFFCAAARAQVMTTFAGTDWFFPANSRPATDAPLASIPSVATDSKGNFYLADATNNIVARVTRDGILSVVAGNGAQGYAGDNGPATSASLYHPSGVAIDSAGNLYIADTSNQRIRKVTPDGAISTLAGTGKPGYSGDGGLATNAQLNSPAGVATDTGGNVYVADTMSHAIRKISSGGVISTVAGTGSPGFFGDSGPAAGAKLSFPYGVALDSAGNLYIADGGNSRIRRISTSGVIATVAGNGSFGFSGDGGPALNAGLGTPHGVTLDAAGNLYIADYQNQRVRKVTPTGIISTIAGSGSPGFSGDSLAATNATLNNPSGVALDSDGSVLIADSQNGRIRRVGPDSVISTVAGNGGYRFSGDSGRARNAVLNSPGGVAIGLAGDVYIADTLNHRVRKVALDGTITTVAGNGLAGSSGDGLLATGASLNGPSGVAIDTAGNLIIADTNNNRIRRVAANGVMSTVAGAGTSSGAFTHPTSVAVDAAGNIYVADYGNNRVRQVTLSGQITTIAGTGLQGFSGDGGPATRAQLFDPVSVALDASRNLYIADSFNNRIRKVTPDGIITTLAGNGSYGSSGDGGPAINAALGGPGGVFADSSGNLYIAETNQSHVRRVTPGGVITTVAGNGDFDFSGDGGPAVNAALNFPEGIAADTLGNLYIADSLNHRVREVISSGTVTFQVSAPALSYSATSAGAPPPAQSLGLSSSIAGLGFAISADVSWLSITPTSGAMPSTLQVTVDPSSLSPGTYRGAITVTAPNAMPSTATITVSFIVQPAPPPQLSVSLQRLVYAVTQGSGPQTAQIQIQNVGGGMLAFSALSNTESGNWLSLSPADGTATPYAPALLTVIAKPGTLSPGTYQGAITLSGGGATVNITVTLAISPASARILISQSGLSFTASAQGGAPLPQVFGVLNTGRGAMDWSATASVLSGGDWLRISPSSGTVAQPYLDISQVNVNIDPTGLAAGDYYGKIEISAGADNSPQLVTVMLTVLPAGVSPGPELRPAALIFTGAAGSTPGSQDVLIGNPKAVSDTFTSAQIGNSFTYLPTNATVRPNEPATLRVFPVFSQLAPGAVQNGVITLLFSDGTARNISVLTVVAPLPVTTGAKLISQAGNCSSPKLQVQFRSPASQRSLTAVLGKPMTIEAQVVDNCGNLIGPGDPKSSSVQAVFSNKDPDLDLVHIGNGVWIGAWKPVNPSSGSVSLTVTAFHSSGEAMQSGHATLSFGTVVSSPTPVFGASGIVHGASLVAGETIAPGSLITILGNNLADDSGLPDSSGTQVLLGGLPLPLFYSSNGQLNAQVPYELLENAQAQLTVQRGTLLSVPEKVVVADAQPGVFTINEQGTGAGFIYKSDGVTLAQGDTPSQVGETVTIYCTGLGAVTPPIPAGMPPSADTPSLTVNPVTVTINGVEAEVTFSGLAPGRPGVYAVKVVVPKGSDLGSGNDVEVTLAMKGKKSPPVIMRRPRPQGGTEG